MPNVSLVSAMSNRMDHLISRQGVVTSNVANANTPGYIARDVTFQKLTERSGLDMASGQLTTTHQKHIHGQGSQVRGDMIKDDSHIRHDGNSVKLDEEMMKLNEIQMNYNAAVQLYNKQKQMQQLVVRSN